MTANDFFQVLSAVVEMTTLAKMIVDSRNR